MRSERVPVNLPAELVAEARSVSVYVIKVVVAGRLRDRSLAALADLYGGPPRSRRARERGGRCARCRTRSLSDCLIV